MNKLKERLDIVLVKRGLAESREKAQALILAGQVLTGDKLLDKAGQKVEVDIEIRIRGEKSPYVSRSALKLLHAIQQFKTDLNGKICLDVGASTGGFTQVCLENGAKKVCAIDVGQNQLHWKIRNDSRVEVFENLNARYLEKNSFNNHFDFVCIDVSFISLKLVLPAIISVLNNNSEVIALIKPQHEVGKENVGKGGIVRDEMLHAEVTKGISDFAESIGFKANGLVESPIKGTTGNKEFLINLLWNN